MNAEIVGALVRHEASHGSRTVMFGWALIAPIVISLVLALVFGGTFTSQPTLGIAGGQGSEFETALKASEGIDALSYTSSDDLLAAVESGTVDVGILLPVDIDNELRASAVAVAIETYTWGQSLAKDRALIDSAISQTAAEFAQRESPITVDIETVGDADEISLRQRLLPMIVLMAIFLGGVFLPGTSMVREKERGTLIALTVTPVTTGDMLMSKGLFGWALSMAMGVITVVLNGAWGREPALLLVTLAIGSVMAVQIGLLLGIFLKDVTTLFAVWKSGGILLFAPGIVYVFPQIPEWVGRIFPTFYLVQPVFAVSLQGAGWAQEWDELAILTGFVVLLGAAIAMLREKMLAYAR